MENEKENEINEEEVIDEFDEMVNNRSVLVRNSASQTQDGLRIYYKEMPEEDLEKLLRKNPELGNKMINGIAKYDQGLINKIKSAMNKIGIKCNCDENHKAYSY